MKIGLGILQDEFQLSGEYQAFHGWLEKLKSEGLAYQIFSPKGHHLRAFHFKPVQAGEFIFDKWWEQWQLIKQANQMAKAVDILHLFLPTPSFLWMADRIKEKTQKPLVVTCLGENGEADGWSWLKWISSSFIFYLVRFLAPLLMPRSQFKADRYIVGNSFVRGQLVRKGCPEDKIHIIAPFVPPEDSQNSLSIDIASQLNAKPTFLYVGHFLPNKGVEILLDAFSQLENKGCHLCLAWSGLGNLKSVQKIIAKKNLDGRVTIVSSRIRLASAFEKALGLIVPTAQSFGQVSPPLILIEAFLHGVPLIISKFPSIADFGEDGRTHFFVRPLDVKDLIEKMEILLKDKALAGEMRRSQRIALSKMANYNLVNLYEQVALENGR